MLGLEGKATGQNELSYLDRRNILRVINVWKNGQSTYAADWKISGRIRKHRLPFAEKGKNDK